MERDYAKELKNFKSVWTRVQSAKTKKPAEKHKCCPCCRQRGCRRW